jgi:S1-C subfamily serine protease
MCSQKLILVLVIIASVAFGGLSPAQSGQQQDLEKSVVLIRSIKQDFDYVTPWKQKAMREGIGSGFVIEGKRVLTNAHNVSNCKYIELRKENIASYTDR